MTLFMYMSYRDNQVICFELEPENNNKLQS